MVDSRHLEAPVFLSPHLLTTTGLAELVWDLKQEVTSGGQEMRVPGWEVLRQVFPAWPHCQHCRPGESRGSQRGISSALVILPVILPGKLDNVRRRKRRPSLIFSVLFPPVTSLEVGGDATG